jgi:SAM-dependent methyltransferase
MSTQGAKKAGVGLSLALPPEVDAGFYRRRWPDLQSLSDAQLAEHYAVFGRNEGRVANPAGERPGFLGLIPPKARILEIGPAHKPCFTGGNVKYFDVQDSDGLRARALTHHENPKGTPSRIDFVSPTGDLGIVRETFDAVFSSHAIEHQPDLIGHLIEVDRLLAPGGAYFVICPDKRYCFDHHIPASTIGEVFEAHAARRQTHRMADFIDAMSMSSHNDPARHWAKDSPPVGVNARLVAQALDQIEKANGGYIDCHAWRMTPSSFREILETLHQLGKSPLRPLRVYDTTMGQNEFFVVLGRGG